LESLVFAKRAASDINLNHHSIIENPMPDIAPEKGVRVIRDNDELCIELHIKVTYGVNIGAIVKSIIHKVKYAVEDATGLQVQRIAVSVDDIVY
jgi:uncharacterized alkaline shock family protein YloU